VRTEYPANHTDPSTVEVDAEDLQWFSLHPPPSVGLPAPIVRLLERLGKDAEIKE
jgi:hypothetical protein